MTKAIARARKNIQVNIEEGGVCAVTINGAKIAEISPEGNVVSFADESTYSAKPSTNPVARGRTGIDIGKDLNTVAFYGARVEQAMDGSLIVYTHGKVVAANGTAVEALKIGLKMKDGTYYVGISPDTKQHMYAAPADAPIRLDFRKAAEYAAGLQVGGKKGFHVPTLGELDVVRQALLKSEELKKTFTLAAASDTAGLYWSSTPFYDYNARCRHFGGGNQHNDIMSHKLSVRCVRS